MGLLTLLFAGTSSLISFKYSLYYLFKKVTIEIVKKLKQWRKSAGHIYNINGTSETIRNETVITERIKLISVHVPIHLKPINDDQFGHYLAGLIDGAGHFNNKKELIIIFHSLNLSLAYFVKKRLGFGKVRKIKDKDTCFLIVTADKGIQKIINLINGKIRTENIYNQIINSIFYNNQCIACAERLDSIDAFNNNKTIDFTFNSNKNLQNHWLAGFTDAHSNFQIKIINDHNKNTKIELNFHINQKCNNILLLIQKFLGGNISLKKKDNTYDYNSISFGSAKKVINYFDDFHLLSNKHINYLKWRKVYIIIQNREHLTEIDINKINRFKQSMNDDSV
uniref:LAGLIDADG endonuclease n=1 Tax=Cordyceps blackwelliae TaxID=2164018 RepID=UPI0022371D19|nr:LAGLIDADG endonuclease [Cordyceps blackwelliae]UYS92294.1 LAGLIDADG endonuclease [Cordyceps blackwelliae]